MTEFDENEPLEEKESPNTGFQFGLLQLNILMLILGIVFAWLRLIPFRREFYWIYIIYFGSLTTYLVLRVPFLLFQISRSVRQAKHRKQQTIQFAEKLRREKGKAREDDGTDFR
ncbi:MAG: hypothetical protein COA78_16250 [Blastopirellula sp.]|nr:MAG: hypothetical protein COA78_16250 [Blastopirellula sp.]